MAVMEINAQNFEEKVNGSAKPVLIDFWAEWCGPCKMLSPIVDELSEERGDIAFGKVNVDLEPALAAKFGITSIPALYFMRGGKVVKNLVGYMPKAELSREIDGVIA